MKTFIIKTAIFFIPLELIILFHLTFDPFRIIYDYEDYYKDSFVAKNRGEICLRAYTNNREEYKFDSFILGSSRSQAFKCVDWEKYLPENSKSLHFDASGESLFGVQTKVSYIDEMGDKINHALIILDDNILSNTENNKGYFVISPPELSKEPVLQYYGEFISAGLDIPFLIGYLDFSLFGNYRPYMKKMISRVKYRHTGDPVNADIFYGNDKHIEEDSTGYYDELISKGVFYKRTPGKKNRTDTLSTRAIKQLNIIKEVFDKHNTNYKIIISPLYDQIPLEQAKIDALNNIFGASNVFNYSGKNEYTEPIYNFYENSHFRPKVARMILNKIYN